MAGQVTYLDHPLIQHKISRLRDKTTGTNEFRSLVEEIAMLMGYEALRDLPTEEVTVETPIETCKTPMIAGRKMAVVPILRAGLGMVSGITALVPTAKIGHIGLYRDEETHEPHEYYNNLLLFFFHMFYAHTQYVSHMFIIQCIKDNLSFSSESYKFRVFQNFELVADCGLRQIQYLRHIAYTQFGFQQSMQDTDAGRISKYFKKFCEIVQFFFCRLLV